MLEYIKRLLSVQTKLAAQFDTAPQPELRERALPAEADPQTEQPEDALEEHTKQETKSKDAAMYGAQEQAVEERLLTLSRQTMQIENLRFREAAQVQTAQTKALEQRMTMLQERQTVDLMARTPDGEGGIVGSWREKMEVAGIASAPSQKSMQEISRFFERDARRYG